MVKSLDERGRVTWATQVKTLLANYGFYFVWLEQGVGDEKMFLSAFKEQLRDCCKQDWFREVSNSTKLDTVCSNKY